MTAPLLVVDRPPPASTLERLAAEGWRIEVGFDLPDEPWDLSGYRWVRSGTIRDQESVAQVVLAAARGAGVVVGCADEPLRGLLSDDLSRIGHVEVVHLGPDPLECLDDDQRVLLAALASGSSIGEAAAGAYLSTRTAERRLAAARKRLGVRTTAEAIALSLRPGAGSAT